MSQQLRVTRKVDFTGAVQVGILSNSPNIGAGRVFYVDGNAGADGYDGTDPNYPKKTILSALGSCTTERNDYIFVLDHWAETAPIEINKSRVHVIGLSLPSFGWVKMNPATDAAMFKLVSAGAYSEIAGIDMSGGDSYGCIWIYGTEGSYIHDCWFGSEGAGGTPLHGIQITQNPHYSRIENCRFFGDLGSANGTITSNGIDCASGINYVRGVEVMNCRFNGLAIGLNLDNADYWQVEDNRFTCPNAQNGEAITLQSDCLDSTFINNISAYGMLNTGYSYNPYRDLATATVNNWSMNYRGNEVIEPVGA